MLTPFLPLFSNMPWTEYNGWILFALYIVTCLLSAVGLMVYFMIVGIYEGFMKDAGKKITFKVKPQWIAYTVAMVIIFTYVGYNGGYENGDSDGFTRGLGLGIQIGAHSYYTGVAPASMRLTLSDASFIYNANEVSLAEYLIIENTDDERVAESPLVLTLVNPVTLKEGLHKDLQTNYTEISITIDGVQKELYHNGNYTDGVLIDAMAVGDLTNVTMTVTLDIASFQDGQSYTCYLYLYQSKAEYADKVEFTVMRMGKVLE